MQRLTLFSVIVNLTFAISSFIKIFDALANIGVLICYLDKPYKKLKVNLV